MITLQYPKCCPKCGNEDIKTIRMILYGRHGPEAWDMINSGSAMSRGCIVAVGDPDWHCDKCRHEWYETDDPIRQERDQQLKDILAKRHRTL